MKSHSSFEGKIIDIRNRSIFEGQITIRDGRIHRIELGRSSKNVFYLPGLIDAHIHIESSLLVPTEFARLALPHGTVATVSDPHEIGNVLGVTGVRYMIENARQTPLKICFGAPSCVPATCLEFETSGASILAEEVEDLLSLDEIGYLAEMMNFPGVLHEDREVFAKIAAALALKKPIDGHFPGGRGLEAKRYIEAGHPGKVTISTDHECFSLEEALEKLGYGMKIIIREGSAAKNLAALHPLFRKTSPKNLMLCSDDRHPDTLVQSHIDELVRRLIRLDYDLFDILYSATITPVEHYNLPVGLLREGDPADFIAINSLSDFKVQQTYVDGELVAENGRCLLPSQPIEIVNNFSCTPISSEDLSYLNDSPFQPIIEVIDGEIYTRAFEASVPVTDGVFEFNPSEDILKLVVVNRYNAASPAVAFTKGFGLKRGALASSVAHDCHNIIAVGTNDEDLVSAINIIISNRGGLSLCDGDHKNILPLPVAGLMSDKNGEWVAERYTELDTEARGLGSTLSAPYMSLSFLALLVIPELKLSNKGLFDGRCFQFVDKTTA